MKGNYYIRVSPRVRLRQSQQREIEIAPPLYLFSAAQLHFSNFV